MKAKEMHTKSLTELEKHIAKLRDKSAQLAREKYLGDTKIVKDIKATRKELARALTIASSKSGEETKKEAA